jgi:hypothetical protein
MNKLPIISSIVISWFGLVARRRNCLYCLTQLFLRVICVHFDSPQTVVSDVAKMQGELNHVLLIYVECDRGVSVSSEHPHAVRKLREVASLLF